MVDLDVGLTSGEVLFIDQYTRSLMVQWCYDAVTRKSNNIQYDPKDKPFVDHAISKKWLSIKDDRILAAGWKTAAAFLKR